MGYRRGEFDGSGWTEQVKPIRDLLDGGYLNGCFSRLIPYLEGS
jgi:hypothetical protein